MSEDNGGRVAKMEKQIEDLHQGFVDMRQDLTVIRMAILGSEQIGHEGMVARQAKLEAEIKELKQFKDRIKYQALGFSAGGAGTAWVALEKLFG